MKKLAFVTCERLPDLSDDDRLALPGLSRAGWKVFAAVWSSPDVDWSSFDGVVIRGTWDYYLHLDRFLAWLERVERLGVPVWNPPALIRENVRKTYLRDLEARGVAIVPTRFVERGDEAGLARALAEAPWPELVVKPEVSADAFRTYRFRREDAESVRSELHATLRRSTLLVQPFLSEVVTEGEYSFLFFGGKYSHAVLKSPARGDFRVQGNHGGTTRAVTPAPALIAQARVMLEAVGQATAYARVDVIRRGEKLLLGELELTEPFLFLGYDPGAPERFASALASVL